MDEISRIINLGVPSSTSHTSYQPSQPGQPQNNQQQYSSQQYTQPANTSENKYQSFAGLKVIAENDPKYPLNVVPSVSFIIPKNIPQEIIDRIIAVMTGIAKAGYGVRYRVTGEASIDPQIIDRLRNLYNDKCAIEVIVPWRGYAEDIFVWEDFMQRNGYKVKRFTATLMHNWNTVKPSIRTFTSTDVHTLVGANAISPAIGLVVWSMDGAETISNLTDETKYHKIFYAVAKKWNIPIFNVRHADAIDRLERQLANYPHVRL